MTRRFALRGGGWRLSHLDRTPGVSTRGSRPGGFDRPWSASPAPATDRWRNRLAEVEGLTSHADLLVEATTGGIPTRPAPSLRGLNEIAPVLQTDEFNPDYGYAALQVDESGRVAWIFPTDETRGRDTLKVFRLSPPVATPRDDGLRGPIVRAARLLVHVVAWPLDAVVGEGALWLAERWERDRRAPELSLRSSDGKVLAGSGELGARPLLLVHGTFSTPEAGFDGLWGSAELADLTAASGGIALAYRHPTLSRDIAANLADFAERARGLAAREIDIVAHSRGGLLARAIAAAGARGDLPFRVRRTIMIGTPNAGTALADPDHGRDFVDAMTGLLEDLPDGPTVLLLEGIVTLVKIIGGGFVGGLPGLQAMRPGADVLASELLGDAGTTDLSALATDFRPDGNPLAKAALATTAQAFFKAPNDGVVPQDGAWPPHIVLDATPDRFRRVTAPPGLHHLNYFSDAGVRAWIRDRLRAP